MERAEVWGSTDRTGLVLAGYAAIVIGCIFIPPAIFTNGPATRLALEHAAYGSITITGYSPYACPDADQKLRTAFSARSPDDADVTGVLCRSGQHPDKIVILTTSDPTRTHITADEP